MTSRTRVQQIFLAAALLICAPARGFAITAAQWQSDLQYLVSHLRSTHPNLFFHVSAQDFNAAVNDLNQRIPQLSDAQITVEIMKLVAMVGDAHTSVYSPFPFLPIRFRWFSDGLFVNAAAPEYSRALGAKVIEIGNLPVTQAYDAVSTVISHENDHWVREMTETYLGTPEILASLGVTSGPGPVRYLFQDMSGARFEIQVSPSSSDLLWPPDSTNGSVPLWRWNYDLNYWFQYLPTTQTIYLAYSRCEEMPDLSFADFLNQVLAFSRQQPVNRIVVDLRGNTGGDSRVFQPFLDLLSANPYLRSKVTAIIGQATISSGVMAASFLSYQFGIPLIGEPSGATRFRTGTTLGSTFNTRGWSSVARRSFSFAIPATREIRSGPTCRCPCLRRITSRDRTLFCWLPWSGPQNTRPRRRPAGLRQLPTRPTSPRLFRRAVWPRYLEVSPARQLHPPDRCRWALNWRGCGWK
jgi:hypothetical protein